MNNKERVTDLLDGKPIDRTPAYDLLRNDVAIEYYTGEKFTLENAKELALEPLE